MSKTTSDNNLLEIALDNIVRWIRTSCYPPPDIQRDIKFDAESNVMRINIIANGLKLASEDLQFFSRDKHDSSARSDIITAKHCIQTIRGNLKVSNIDEGNSCFEITIDFNDPLQKLREVDLKLWALLHPWQALKMAWKGNRDIQQNKSRSN